MAVNSVAGNAVPMIAGALEQAARSTGVSFEYLLATAQIESNLNPSAQAPTSSAKGLFQFIEQTWLGTMKEQGAALGLGRYARSIVRLPDGRYDVSDADQRTAIMRLRGDPNASAMMAGAFARSNAAQLQATLGRQPSEGELYIAHFLGPEGAGRLIAAAASQPAARAADMFPQAAAANPGIFLDRAGRTRSVSEVYATLTGRFDFARAASAVPIRGSLPAHTDTPVPQRAPAAAAQAYAKVSEDTPLPDSKPLFQAMFTDRPRLRPSAEAHSTPARLDEAATPTAIPIRGLSLFADNPSDGKRLFNGKF